MPLKLLAHDRVVLLDDIPPLLIAACRGRGRAAHDVGEEEGGQEPPAPAGSGFILNTIGRTGLEEAERYSRRRSPHADISHRDSCRSDEVANTLTHEDLPGPPATTQMRGDNGGRTDVLPSAMDALASIDAESDVDLRRRSLIMARESLGDVDGRANRVGREAEDQMKPVARLLQVDTPGRSCPPHDPLIGAQVHQRFLLAAVLKEVTVARHVGEQVRPERRWHAAIMVGDLGFQEPAKLIDSERPRFWGQEGPDLHPDDRGGASRSADRRFAHDWPQSGAEAREIKESEESASAD